MGKTKSTSSVGLRYTSEVKVEVAQIRFQRGAITHADEWPEISANDETKFILVMYGALHRAVLFEHKSAQLKVHHFLCFVSFSSIDINRYGGINITLKQHQ